MTTPELTPREHDVLLLLCQGLSNRAIADRLTLSVDTVKWYNKQLYTKLNVTNRVQAVLVARAQGLAPVPEPSLLPRFLTDFIGRADAIDTLCDLLNDHRLITLAGPGGIGKTRLAVEIATCFAPLYRPYFVPFAERTSDVLSVVAEHLGIASHRAISLLQTVIDLLTGQPTLLILDGFEQTMQGTELLVSILKRVSEVRLLVTSRHRLHIYGETVYVLDGLVDEEALALFLDRAEHADATFEPDHDQLVEIRAICCLLDGVPLAIEHAASWIHMLEPAAILAEIRNGLDFLKSNARGIDARHQNIRTVIDWSWDQLSVREREVLMRLALFRGPFSRHDAVMVAQTDLDVLSGLLEKSFIKHVDGDRCAIPALQRQYTLEKLHASDDCAEVEAGFRRFMGDG